jgi:hypothetical protein
MFPKACAAAIGAWIEVPELVPISPSPMAALGSICNPAAVKPVPPICSVKP